MNKEYPPLGVANLTLQGVSSGISKFANPTKAQQKDMHYNPEAYGICSGSGFPPFCLRSFQSVLEIPRNLKIPWQSSNEASDTIQKQPFL